MDKNNIHIISTEEHLIKTDKIMHKSAISGIEYPEWKSSGNYIITYFDYALEKVVKRLVPYEVLFEEEEEE